jgi:hypothetical protein
MRWDDGPEAGPLCVLSLYMHVGVVRSPSPTKKTLRV